MAWTIGWKETRTDGHTTYYEPLDGDLDDVELDDMEPEYGRRIFPDERLKYGRRVVREGLPRKIQFNGNNHTIPEVGDCYTHIFVSSEIRDIVEEFEPEVHQFFPVEVLYQDGRHGADRFWLNVCQRLATIHPTKSVPPLTSTVWGPVGGSIPDPIVSREVV